MVVALAGGAWIPLGVPRPSRTAVGNKPVDLRGDVDAPFSRKREKGWGVKALL